MPDAFRDLPPDADPAATPDLAQLLADRDLSHWHGPLLELCQRHQGWLADYELIEACEPDFLPISDILAAVGALPAPRPGDAAMAKAIACCDFMARAALNVLQGNVRWDALSESYRGFKKAWPDRHPYWAGIPARTEERLLDWALGHGNAAV